MPLMSKAYYRIGRRLDADGRVTAGWTDWRQVPDWFSWDNEGAGIAVVEGERAGDHDLSFSKSITRSSKIKHS